MPIYEYDCHFCGILRQGTPRQERFLPMARCEEPQTCSTCGAKLTRVFSVPQIQTGSTFQAMNGGLGGAQFANPEVREHYLTEARKGGVNPEGKFYEGRIARFPGDPEAWVQSRDETREVLERRGWGCDGDIKVQGRDDGSPPADVPIADDLVEQLVEGRLEKEFGPDFTEVSGKPVEQARDEVLSTHAAKWSPP